MTYQDVDGQPVAVGDWVKDDSARGDIWRVDADALRLAHEPQRMAEGYDWRDATLPISDIRRFRRVVKP
jgi:hypothetical protein